jgi:hypothetical protein
VRDADEAVRDAMLNRTPGQRQSLLKEAPVLELRPATRLFMRDAVRRARSDPAIASLLFAGLAGLGAAIAFGRSSALMIVGITLAATVLLALAVLGWFALTVFGARWSCTRTDWSCADPVQRGVSDLAAVKLESIGGFGMRDPILVFLDGGGGVLLWTVASRWADADLNQYGCGSGSGRRTLSALSSTVRQCPTTGATKATHFHSVAEGVIDLIIRSG